MPFGQCACGVTVKRITLKAYAKINLGLAVLGRREDGYHELRTVFQTISLADGVEVRLSPGSRAVHLETTGLAIPGERNLAAAAAEAALEELRLRAKVTVLLDKRIPPGSGLGGASSDAAAVLRGVLWLAGRTAGRTLSPTLGRTSGRTLGRTLGQILPGERLLRLAAKLGSDVPFFLYGGRAIGLGRGEEVYPLPEEPRRHCVLFFPGKGMDTAEAYRSLRRPRLTPLTASPTIDWIDRINLFSSAVSGSAEGARLENDFEPSVFRKYPELAQAKKILRRAGAEAASLSGSGTAVYGLFRDSAKARRAAQQLRGRGEQVFLARTVSRREFEAQFRA